VFDWDLRLHLRIHLALYQYRLTKNITAESDEPAPEEDD
jgi:hypothetical protein